LGCDLERRRFGERQPRRRVSEVMARAGLDAVPTAAEVDLVEVGLEDRVLRVVTFHLARGRLFPQLARDAGGAAHLTPIDDVGVHVPDELLRDRASAAAILVEDLALDRGHHRTEIDPVVLVKALVLY
jgi:hypothetical protein